METRESQKETHTINHVPSVAIIPEGNITALHSMLKKIINDIEVLSEAVQQSNAQKSELVVAPDSIEVSLSFLAAATNLHKATIRRRIDKGQLPPPQVNPYNGYLFWCKKDLPTNLHPAIDAHYASLKASR